MNIGSQEETLLETYFSNLAGFKFEQAREICVSLFLVSGNPLPQCAMCEG